MVGRATLAWEGRKTAANVEDALHGSDMARQAAEIVDGVDRTIDASSALQMQIKLADLF